MYDIRQFRPTLYLLIVTGVTGFCLAARAPGLWLLAGVALAGHYLMTRSGVLRALPSWAAAGIALVFGLFTFQRFMADSGSALLVAGQFLVLLQLVKLYQEGAGNGDLREENRNYAWLLVLSLLLMVAASISTASLLFGLVLIVYLFLSLYCCLLFHLKSETESIRAVMTLPKDVVNPAVLRQDERFLPRSMRRLTVLVASAGLLSAVVVFLFFPRGPGAGLLGQLNLRPAQAMTGFSEQVSFESVARITQSTERVAAVELLRDGKPVRGTETLYLRGITLDTYSGNGRSENEDLQDTRGSAPWQWTRTAPIDPSGPKATLGPNEPERLGDLGPSPLVQNIHLEPTGVPVLFAAPGAAQIAFPRENTRYTFVTADESLRLIEPLGSPIDYTVWSRGTVGFRNEKGLGPLSAYPRSRIDPRIGEFARRPEVSGVDADGTPLASKRKGPGGVIRTYSPLDERIAENIERYLKTEGKFAYTLDLTDTTRRSGEDPIVQFLYETKRGHCEYFAGAMVLLCQSLGLEARMVTGFRADEFNGMIGRYVVRQSDAHAWVEVRLANRGPWRTFDPTTAREANVARATSVWGRVRRVFDYLEYTWADSVVAYNRDRRENLLTGVEKGVTSAAVRTSSGIRNWDEFLPEPSAWGISPRLVGAVIGLMAAAGVGSIGYFLWERWKLRRRAQRIGLGDLPDDDRLRLARQLGFYDDLLRTLESRGYRRPPNQTPLEFAHSLAHLPAEVYESIHRLTRIYYRIRYGRAGLTAGYQRRVREAVARIGPELGNR